MDFHPFRILSLCSGVGGIELGFKLAEPNARTICYVEIEAFACEILAHRMEEERLDAAPIWTNLKTFDGKPWRGKVDCITGGYPCQPFSVAGRKLGDKDPRHLWPEIKRLITEIEPPICFFENVGGHLRLGFEEVANDLQAMGYKIKAGLFTAEEVGAPHKRERLFILAYSDSFGSPLQSDRNTTALERKSAAEKNGRHQFAQTTSNCSSRDMANCSFSRCSNGRDNIAERHLCQNSFGESKKDQQERHERITGSCKNSENLGESPTRELADNNSDGCVSNESKITRKDDQERWQECSEKPFAGGNDFATTGFSKEQRGFEQQESGFALSDEESLVNCNNSRLQETRTKFISTRIARGKQELADCQNLICEWCQQEGNRNGQSKTKTRSDDNKLANSESSRARQHKSELWQGTEKHSRKLANSQCLRCGRRSYGMEGRQSSQIETSGSQRSCCAIMGDTTSKRLEGWQCQESNTDQLYTWPPSPTSYDEWERIPDYLKPAIHRMADGLADRVDSIRACGNGVVPLVAAYAWRTLTNGMYLTKNNELKTHE